MSDGREPHESPSLSLDRRRFLVGGLLAAGAATAYARKPSEVVSYLGDRKLEDLISQGTASEPLAVIALYEGQAELIRRLADRSDDISFGQTIANFHIEPGHVQIA